MSDAVASSNTTSMPLFEWLRPRAPLRVINYFPQYSDVSISEEYKDYCRVRLMLHHPFEQVTDLLQVDGDDYESYIDAFDICREVCLY
jgi:hypothetical protein